MAAPLNEPVGDDDKRTLDSLRKIQFAPVEAKQYLADYIGGGIRVPASRVDGLPNLLPWLIDIDVFSTAITNTNWDTVSADVDYIHGGVKGSSGAQNAVIGFDVVLAAGVWTIELMHATSTNRGIYSVQLGGVEKGTIDGYSAALTRNVRSTVSAVTVAVTGKVRLTLKMATKNASSSSYFGAIQHLQLRRTA